METVLLKSPPVDQKDWIFNVWPDQLDLEPDQLQDAEQSRTIYGKRITFKESEIILKIEELPNNRILQEDDPSKFIVLSFRGLRGSLTPSYKPRGNTSKDYWRPVYT